MPASLSEVSFSASSDAWAPSALTAGAPTEAVADCGLCFVAAARPTCMLIGGAADCGRAVTAGAVSGSASAAPVTAAILEAIATDSVPVARSLDETARYALGLVDNPGEAASP